MPYGDVYAQYGGEQAYLDLLYGKNRQGLNAASNKSPAEGGTGKYSLPAEWYGAGGKLDPEAIFAASVSDYRKQQGEAKQANEARLGELRTGWAGMESMVEGLGQQEGADIRAAYDNAYAKEHQRLSAQGMGRTSLGSQVRLATEREKTADLARLNERTTQQRLGVTQGKLGMIERVTDEYPQMDQAALLGMQLGQSQGAGAAGAGGRYAMLGTVGAGGARSQAPITAMTAGGPTRGTARAGYSVIPADDYYGTTRKKRYAMAPGYVGEDTFQHETE